MKVYKLKQLRICARCGRIYWGITKTCPEKCDFGSYQASWVYDGYILPIYIWVKQIWTSWWK
jgi:uncharacterized protein YifN (PemK superfamily)